MRTAFVLALVLFVPLPLASAQAPPSRAGDARPADPYEPALTALLQAVVTPDGLVRYDRLRGDQAEAFRRVLKAVEDYDPARLDTRRARLAFWMNAYNVQMLAHVTPHPGLARVTDGDAADRFFRTPVRTAGLALSLDAVEHALLRGAEAPPPAAAPYRVRTLDPRIHAGINCAAVSCPALPREAFAPERVDAQLDRLFAAFVDSPRHLRVEGDGFVLSSILDWFGADFDAGGVPMGDRLLRAMDPERPGYDALRSFLAGKTSAEIRADPRVAFAYDWTVNRAP